MNNKIKLERADALLNKVEFSRRIADFSGDKYATMAFSVDELSNLSEILLDAIEFYEEVE